MKIFWRFFRYLKPYLKPLILANMFMIIYVFANLLSIGILMPFIDLLFNEQTKTTAPQNINIFNLKNYLTFLLNQYLARYSKVDLVAYLSILMLLIFTAKNLFSYMQTYFMSFVEQGIVRDIRLELYTHFHKLSLGFFSEEKKGILISRIINDVQIVKDSMIAVINSIFRDPTQIIIFSLVLFLFDWKLTLLIFILLPVTGFILSIIGDSIKRRSIRSQESIANVMSLLDEIFGAMRIVKAFNMETREIEKFKNEDKKYFALITSLVRRRALAAPITEIIGVISVTVILYFIGSEIVSGKSDMTPGSFLVYIGIFFQMMPSLKLFGQMFNSIKEGIAASERVFSILDTKPDIVDAVDCVDLKSFNTKIEFVDVSFKYEKSYVILKDLNLTISKGEIVAIVGPSGAGKSSLVDLIQRFHDVLSGSILIDGIDIRKVKIASLRKLMGLVSQETVLFNDSIKNNIAYGDMRIEDDKIIEAAKIANAHNFISEMENGYETIIGDRGVKLSGGEKQRISIARAILRNPPILILDEATSSLDTESEMLVQQAIERIMTGRTSVVIAHRLSTVQNADKIIVLNDGNIVETGSHSELHSQNGLYTKLYNMQFKL